METRQEIVEYLLFMMYEHACCSDPKVYHSLYEEAKREGWKLPEGD